MSSGTEIKDLEQQRLKTTAVIFAKNEASTIGAVVENVKGYVGSIVIGDGCSVDNTQKIVQEKSDQLEVYMGYANPGVETSSSDWLVRKNTYDANDNITLSQTAYGAWDDRESLSYE